MSKFEPENRRFRFRSSTLVLALVVASALAFGYSILPEAHANVVAVQIVGPPCPVGFSPLVTNAGNTICVGPDPIPVTAGVTTLTWSCSASALPPGAPPGTQCDITMQAGLAALEPRTNPFLGGPIDSKGAVPTSTQNGLYKYTISFPTTTVSADPYVQLGGGLVGGTVLPIDKLALLAPYIGFASIAVAGTVLAVVHLNRVKSKKTNAE